MNATLMASHEVIFINASIVFILVWAVIGAFRQCPPWEMRSMNAFISACGALLVVLLFLPIYMWIFSFTGP